MWPYWCNDHSFTCTPSAMQVWCTMAECLGWDAMKSEMEDLCFAVLQVGGGRMFGGRHVWGRRGSCGYGRGACSARMTSSAVRWLNITESLDP